MYYNRLRVSTTQLTHAYAHKSRLRARVHAHEETHGVYARLSRLSLILLFGRS